MTTDAMTTCEPLRGVFIGEGVLPILCADLWLARGHEIVALMSPDPRLAEWASANAMAHAADLAGLEALIDAAPFDYLLSIANFQKLPSRIVEAAECCAINYHDAPLPRYAGSHATSWALLNGETRHAVTWHVVTARIDAGDVLVQVPVDIDPDDTALTLNAKCFEAAIDGFDLLLDDLQAGGLHPCPQDLARRTFHRRSQRPAAGCSLRFDAPAERLYDLQRALDFGPYPNPLGLPKLPLGEAFAIVTGLEVLDSRTGDVPGTVVGISATRLVFTTASHDVALGGLLDIHGAPITIAEAVECAGLRVGAVMAPIAPARAARLTAWCAELAGHEAFWMAQLGQASPTRVAGASRLSDGLLQAAGRCGALDVDLGPWPIAPGELAAGPGLAALLLFFARLAGTDTDTGFNYDTDADSIAIGWSDPQLCVEVDDLHPYIATWLPLRVRIDPDGSFPRLVQAVQAQLLQLREHRSYVRDAPLRDPALRARPDAVDPAGWPIGVQLLDWEEGVPTQPHAPGRVLTVRLAVDGRACQWLYDPGVIDPARVARMSRQFTDLLRTLTTHAAHPIGALRRLA